MPSHPYTPDDPVVAQYERWAFPEPVDDLNHPSLARYLDTFRTLKYMSPVYWPAGQPAEELEILVAGCGTMAAACVAYLYPRHRVLGIDISHASLAHEEKLKQRYKLTNLSLERCPVEQVGGLGRSFDYASCHGVLHHTPDPPVALRALGTVLKPQGVIGIMLYAKYGRVPVYMMQDLFSLLGLKQTKDDVALARQTLLGLSAEHPLRPHLSTGAFDIASDAAVVDMFLHPRDIAYSVADCLTLVREAGLAFGGWDQKQSYYPDALVPRDSALRKRIDQLPLEKQWAAMELLIGRISLHWFHVFRADRDPATYRIPWDSDELLNWIPLRAAELMRLPDLGSDGQVQHVMVAEGFPPVRITGEQAAVFSQIDGRKTVVQCVAAAGVQIKDRRVPEFVQNLLELLFRAGYGTVCLRR